MVRVLNGAFAMLAIANLVKWGRPLTREIAPGMTEMRGNIPFLKPKTAF